MDREVKDTYLFYKTALIRRPILAIGNREWKARGGVVNTEQNECVQSVPVFSNAEEVELFVNNKSLGKKKRKAVMPCLMCRLLMGKINWKPLQ